MIVRREKFNENVFLENSVWVLFYFSLVMRGLFIYFILDFLESYLESL